MTTQTNKTIALLAIALAATFTIQAQTDNENTSTRLIDQLKNGTAPGLQFTSKQRHITINDNTTNTKDNTIAQIKKGTAPGMQFKGGGGTTIQQARSAAKPAGESHQPLPSEQPAAKQEPAKAATNTAIPTQEVQKAN